MTKKSRPTRGRKRDARQAEVERLYFWGLTMGFSDREIAHLLGWKAKRPDDYFRIYRSRGYYLPQRGMLEKKEMELRRRKER